MSDLHSQFRPEQKKESDGLHMPPILATPTLNMEDLRFRFLVEGSTVAFLEIERFVDASVIPVLRKVLEETPSAIPELEDPRSAPAAKFDFLQGISDTISAQLAKEALNEARPISWRREALVRMMDRLYGPDPDLDARAGEPNAVQGFRSTVVTIGNPTESRPQLSIALDGGTLRDWANGVRVIRHDFLPSRDRPDMPVLRIIDRQEPDGARYLALRMWESIKVYELPLNDYPGMPVDGDKAIEVFTETMMEEGIPEVCGYLSIRCKPTIYSTSLRAKRFSLLAEPRLN